MFKRKKKDKIILTDKIDLLKDFPKIEAIISFNLVNVLNVKS